MKLIFISKENNNSNKPIILKIRWNQDEDSSVIVSDNLTSNKENMDADTGIIDIVFDGSKEIHF
ncbi:hypothetical protein MASR1M45_06020 [Candidatus Kapaibacterium sp.]